MRKSIAGSLASCIEVPGAFIEKKSRMFGERFPLCRMKVSCIRVLQDILVRVKLFMIGWSGGSGGESLHPWE